MIYRFIVSNIGGTKIDLCNNEYCYLTKCNGLNPVNADIATTNKYGNGITINSKNIHFRNILLTLKMRSPIEIHRQKLYEVLSPGMRVYFDIKTENTAEYHTYGYVESFENDHFTKGQYPQISIICEDPFFTMNSSESSDQTLYLQSTTTSGTVDVTNIGNQNAKNFKIILSAVSDSAGAPKLTNTTTLEKIEFLNTSSLESLFKSSNSGKITIDVENKVVTFNYTDSGSAKKITATSWLTTNSEFPQLVPGKNTFKIDYDKTIRIQTYYTPTVNGI
jgi:hypothetical protein